MFGINFIDLQARNIQDFWKYWALSKQLNVNRIFFFTSITQIHAAAGLHDASSLVIQCVCTPAAVIDTTDVGGGGEDKLIFYGKNIPSSSPR